MIKYDDNVWLTEHKGKLYQWVEKLSQLSARSETLFIIDDIMVDESLDKQKQSLIELAISGRHRNHYLRLLNDLIRAYQKIYQDRIRPYFFGVLKKSGS